MRLSKHYSAQDMWNWLEDNGQMKIASGKPLINKERCEMLRVVCQRMCEDLAEYAVLFSLRFVIVRSTASEPQWKQKSQEVFDAEVRSHT